MPPGGRVGGAQGSPGADPAGVKDDEVCSVPVLHQPSTRQPQPLGGERGHLAHGLRQVQ